MRFIVYHYPKCATSRKALAWLDKHEIAYEAIDLVATPPSKEKLKDLWKRSGEPIRKLFNTSGESYRKGGFKDKLATMSDADALTALAADGKLIKRPLVDMGQRVIVGFREEDYAQAFAGLDSAK
ncbi:MAG TPA: Spx/MgsR family RNA polymerase-binding regulatory protein [Polyangiaceae bacterium]|jgi:arsenate reductase|nr:MAG: Regulatory protein MgsR [Deltaproteobacteria bacterium ADurb.Bin207]HNS97613.1 Spx/MgsR family RNA polymerase-binding regulatory protein [Polyangiaceae bacterium]HNZ25295.1 Spx/MgsR family RNA polymerase-binding regulatory protein [Polyangiaceae bacterium]HOD24509.1 Spx/MgsR family RNA polymerase-binding regulatory protein [Polyangiaceae bacterium]HOE50418.1 Spx/MgsR family RNA polymerase-binding regulatory protein [Polyangiaceae bacterium]